MTSRPLPLSRSPLRLPPARRVGVRLLFATAGISISLFCALVNTLGSNSTLKNTTPVWGAAVLLLLIASWAWGYIQYQQAKAR